MSYLVELHACGGSMSEAVPPVKVVHVETEQEANAVADMVHNHPANKDYEELWAILVEVPPVLPESDAVKEMLENFYFKEYDY